MSRIADVLQKARQEERERNPELGALQPSVEHLLRPIADVAIPWQLEEKPNSGGRASSGVQETIDSLVRRLFLTNGAEETRVRRVLFAAIDESGNAVEIARQVAERLAGQSTGSVCLADLDLHRPTLHRQFQLEGRVGFSDAITGAGPARTFAHEVSSASNLRVMPAGTRALEVMAVLGRPETRRRLTELLDSFDHVVAVTAIVADHPDAKQLGAAFDGVVLVVQPGSTKPEAVRAAADTLRMGSARLLGTLLDRSV